MPVLISRGVVYRLKEAVANWPTRRTAAPTVCSSISPTTSTPLAKLSWFTANIQNIQVSPHFHQHLQVFLHFHQHLQVFLHFHQYFKVFKHFHRHFKVFQLRSPSGSVLFFLLLSSNNSSVKMSAGSLGVAFPVSCTWPLTMSDPSIFARRK
jgi:hypothetical protein